MSVEIGNEDGHLLGQFASNLGYTELIEAARDYPALMQFFNTGYAVDDGIKTAHEELKQLAESHESADVAKTALGLSSLIGSESLVYITNGASDSEEEDDDTDETSMPTSTTVKGDNFRDERGRFSRKPADRRKRESAEEYERQEHSKPKAASIFQYEHVIEESDLQLMKQGVVPIAQDTNQSANIDAGFASSPGGSQSSTVEVGDPNNPGEYADHKPMTQAMSQFFKAAAQGAMDRLHRIKELHKVRKDDKPDADELLNAANDIDWATLVPVVQPLLYQAADFGVTSGLHQAQVAGVGNIAAYIGKSQELAADYARERAAEMVGMKLVDGVLQPNPNARWNIAMTTRDELRDLITKSLEERTDIDDLAKQIQEAGVFSDWRAEMIAKTETAKAQSEGVVHSWRTTGAVEKVRWSPSSLGPCPDCLDNVLAGSIVFGEPFPTGDIMPPGHPSCRCALIITKVRGKDERPIPQHP